MRQRMGVAVSSNAQAKHKYLVPTNIHNKHKFCGSAELLSVYFKFGNRVHKRMNTMARQIDRSPKVLWPAGKTLSRSGLWKPLTFLRLI